MNRARRVAGAARAVPRLLRTTFATAWRHRILGLSAEAAFWQLLSLPSLLLALLASLGYVSRLLGHNTVNRAESQLISLFSRAFTHEVVNQLVTPTLTEILDDQRADVVSIGFALALWAGSSAMATFVNTITIAYGMRDLRGPVRSRLLALWLSLGSILVAVTVLPALVLGPGLLSDVFPVRDRAQASSVIHAAYYPVVASILLIGLATLYHLAPPRRLPWHRGVPGAVLALGIFFGGSAGLRAYIDFILSHNHAYGTLATPIAALLFFYVLALGVLLGAEFNAAIERGSPTPARGPRALARGWQRVHGGEADEVGTGDAENDVTNGGGAGGVTAQLDEPPPAGSDS